MMEFKFEFLAKLHKRASQLASDETEYNKLLKFEEVLVEHLRFNQLEPAHRLEAHRVLAMINTAQITVLEKELGADINGDGYVGESTASAIMNRK